MYSYEDICEILPEGAVTREEWDRPAAKWLHKMRWELIVEEAKRLPMELLFTIGKIAEVEDFTSYYVLYLMAVRNLGLPQIDFRDNKWEPEEKTHAVAAHAVYDSGKQNTVSERHQRNEQACAHMSLPLRAGSAVLRVVAGNLTPELMETLIYLKGFKNELAAERYYEVEADIMKSLGFAGLRKLLRTPAAQERVHGARYREFALEHLEGNARLQKIARLVMQRDNQVVGSEIRTDSETIRMVQGLEARIPGRLHELGQDADNQFEALPGMKGIRPFEASLKIAA